MRHSSSFWESYPFIPETPFAQRARDPLLGAPEEVVAGAQREDERLQSAGDGAHRDPDGAYALPPPWRQFVLGLRLLGG